MKRFHVALAVSDVARSVLDYTKRLGVEPTVIVPDEYALWRTASLNLSIRRTQDVPGTLRHLGWEDPSAAEFSVETDINGLPWEIFSSTQQAEEIRRYWPDAEIRITDLRD